MLDQVGDEAAIYSPLARGASLLSDRGYLDGGACGGATPRSLASVGPPLVSDGGGTPRSPWCVLRWRLLKHRSSSSSSSDGSPPVP